MRLKEDELELFEAGEEKLVANPLLMKQIRKMKATLSTFKTPLQRANQMYLIIRELYKEEEPKGKLTFVTQLLKKIPLLKKMK